MTPMAGAGPGASVHCVGLTHLYPGTDEPVVALRGADLHLNAGEVVALLGPSGSGKSTLLGALAGLFHPTAGRVVIGEQDLTRMSPPELTALRASAIGIVLQDPGANLLPYATAAQNVQFARRGRRSRHGHAGSRHDRAGSRHRHADEAPADLLRRLGVGHLAGRVVGQLSGGEQQRVAIATGLASEPGLLLVDEPTSQLDPSTRDAVLATLLRANEELGTTILVVTHDPAIAAALPRTVTIRQGQTGLEGRAGKAVAVVAAGGTVQLPDAVLAAYPPGSVLEIEPSSNGIWLRPPGADR